MLARGHQAPKKATCSLQKEVGQNIKDKKREKRDPSRGGSCEGGKVSKHQETLSLAGLWRVLNLRGQHNWEEKGKTKNPQTTHLTATPSGEVAQILTTASSKQGLNREVPAVLLRVRTRPKCPEDNLRDLR